MFLAKVVGNLVASAKYPTLEGRRLVLLQPLDSRLESKGKIVVSTDSLGTGYGEIVMVITSKEAGIPYQEEQPLVPTDHCVVGIIDRVDLTGVCDICRDIACPRSPGDPEDRCRGGAGKSSPAGPAVKKTATKKTQTVRARGKSAKNKPAARPKLNKKASTGTIAKKRSGPKGKSGPAQSRSTKKGGFRK